MYRERKGVLLIADISGYTEYLESTEFALPRPPGGDHLHEQLQLPGMRLRVQARHAEAAPLVDRRHVERYEHVGSVELGVWDLGSERQPATA